MTPVATGTPIANAQPASTAGVVLQPGGEIALGTPVPIVAKPAYPGQAAPPAVLLTPNVVPVAQGTVVPASAAPHYYAQTTGFQPSPHAVATATAVPVTGSSAPVAQSTPVAPGAPAGQSQLQPRPEVTASFTNGDLRSTAQARYSGEATQVTHANFFWNDIERIEAMERFPNLIRLTLRGNHLTSLLGLSSCPHLRWIDVSTNDLKDFRGATNVASLEWLDAHDNNLTSLEGLGFAPQLRWLNVQHADLRSLAGLRSVPGLRVLNAAENELGTTSGVEHCPQLIELNLHTNNLTDLSGVHTLRELRALDVSSNELDDVPVALGGCTQLHTLALVHNNLGSRNAEGIVSAFAAHANLRLLKIGRNEFVPADEARIRAALAPNGTELDTSGQMPQRFGGGGGAGGGSSGDCGGCTIA